MKLADFPHLTVCGLEELHEHGGRRVSHVLSILDPDWPDPASFGAYAEHTRITLRFHDAIEPAPGTVLPQPPDVEAILRFGRDIDRGEHLLVHCHAGISRSTAALLTLLAQAHPNQDEIELVARLLAIRPQAWPNSRMVGFADEMLSRGGRLCAAVGRLYARRLEDRPELGEIMKRLDRAREVAIAQASVPLQLGGSA